MIQNDMYQYEQYKIAVKSYVMHVFDSLNIKLFM